MKNEITIDEKIQRLQASLVTLRTVAGWKADELANKIGLTRQYYSEIENLSKNMSRPLYFGFLYLFEQEATNNKNLKEVLDVCLNEKTLSVDTCKNLSTYIASERKKKKEEIAIASTVSAIVGAVATGIITIIVKAMIKK